jgi:hypothetical protein
MEGRGWTGYGEGERDPKPPVPPPDFTGMNVAQIETVIEDLLSPVMEPRWLAQWWDAEIFDGQTPRQMLEGGRFRQLWLTAESTAAEDEHDIIEIEHIRD